MSLQKLSDQDLNRLYNDAKAGIRGGTDYVENDGDDSGGYSRRDFYSGQTMSSDHTRGGYDEDELMELSNMYRDNVYTDYKGGRLGEEDIRKGFSDIFDEKERRRIKYIDDGRYKPPAEEPKQEVKAKAEPSKPRPEAKVELEAIKPFEGEQKPQISGFAGSTWNPEGGAEAPGAAEYSKAKEKAQSFQVSSGKPDYSFNAGGYGSQTAGADAYGNVPASDMDAEHQAEQLKNSHLGKVKTLM